MAVEVERIISQVCERREEVKMTPRIGPKEQKSSGSSLPAKKTSLERLLSHSQGLETNRREVTRCLQLPKLFPFVYVYVTEREVFLCVAL